MKTIAMLTALSCVAGAARAQRAGFSLRFDAANVWARTDAVGLNSVLRGPAFGGEGRITLGRFFLSVRYLEGQLRLNSGAAQEVRQNLVDGAISLAARPFPWLEVSVGPAARAYVTDSTTERWMLWRVRTRIEAPLSPHGLSSYVELWRSFVSDINVPAGAGRVQGGETGLIYRPRGRYSLRLSYHLDDALLGVPGRSETLEAVTFGVAIEGL
jgi:hypothetical protein